jgi:hypothetical protein
VPLLERVIDARHFAELLAEEWLCPRGPEQENLRAAMLAVVSASVWSKKPVPLDAYLRVLQPRLCGDGRQTAEEQKLMAMRVCAAMGGRIVQGVQP